MPSSPNIGLTAAEERVSLASHEAIALAVAAISDTALQEALLNRAQAIGEETSAAARAQLLESLRTLGLAEQFTTLVETIAATTDDHLRAAAAQALIPLAPRSQLHAPGRGAEIVRLLQSPTPASCARSLLFVVSQLQIKVPLSLLIKLLLQYADQIEVQWEILLLVENDRLVFTASEVHSNIERLRRAIAKRGAHWRPGDDYLGEALAALTEMARRH